MKLIVTPLKESTRIEVFDLASDPSERQRLPDHGPEQDALRARLRDWLAFWKEVPPLAVDIELDEEQLRMLRSLGYIR